MSVLDRAIVKAFQRRDSEAARQAAAVERCAVVPEPVAPSDMAISHVTEARGDRFVAPQSAPEMPSSPVANRAPEPVPEAVETLALPPLPEWIAPPLQPPLPVEALDVPHAPAAATPLAAEPPHAQPDTPDSVPSPRPRNRLEDELQSPIVHSRHEPGTTGRTTYSASYLRSEPTVELEKPAAPYRTPTVGYTATEPTSVLPPVVTPPPAPPVPERPAVQQWKWPEICEQLDQFTGEGFRQLAKHLQFAADEGHKTLAFVSSSPGTGRTSVLLTLTRILALEGKSDVLLIDADRRHPQLVSIIPDRPAVGLREVLEGQLRMDQAVIPMTPGRVAALPLNETLTDAEWQPLVAPLRALLKQARRNYDMILIDAGVVGPETRLPDCWLRGAADAVITISRQLTGKQTEHQVLDWKQIGIESLGVIETFA